MTQSTRIVAAAAALIMVTGPIALGLLGVIRNRRPAPAGSPDRVPPDWKLTINSASLYALTFSVIFFIQELFLVLPKALTPGLHATLFHNDHHWVGSNPLARLFQGTGALAILLTAIACAWWLKRRPPRSVTLRLCAIWMTFNGFFQSLPQVVLGAVFPANDVGMAMSYLHLAPAVRVTAALLALAAIALIGCWLTRPVLQLARHANEIDTGSRRTRFIFRAATLPALIAVPVIVLFRVPGTIDQVVIVPVAVTLIGISWLQASAWSVESASPGEAAPGRSILYPLNALVVLFLIFQLVLRRGIDFF